MWWLKTLCYMVWMISIYRFVVRAWVCLHILLSFSFLGVHCKWKQRIFKTKSSCFIPNIRFYFRKRSPSWSVHHSFHQSNHRSIWSMLFMLQTGMAVWNSPACFGVISYDLCRHFFPWRSIRIWRYSSGRRSGLFHSQLERLQIRTGTSSPSKRLKIPICSDATETLSKEILFRFRFQKILSSG